MSGKGDVFSKEVEKGSYLLELSGHFTCSAGGQQKHDVTWTIAVEGEKYEITTSLYTNGGYGFPFSFRKEFITKSKSKLNISAVHRNSSQFNITSGIISLSPMIKTN